MGIYKQAKHYKHYDLGKPSYAIHKFSYTQF